MATLKAVHGVNLGSEVRGRRSHPKFKELRSLRLWLNDEEKAVIISGADHVEVEFFAESTPVKIIIQKQGSKITYSEYAGNICVGGGGIEQP